MLLGIAWNWGQIFILYFCPISVISDFQTICKTRPFLGEKISIVKNKDLTLWPPADYGLTTAGLAEALGVSRQTINEVLREKRAISPVMALRLAQLFGNTPEFWLNAQRAYDLWQAKQDYQPAIKKIKPLRTAWGEKGLRL
jgi:addiction module HigA family antidote